jgi:hypothetical protein
MIFPSSYLFDADQRSKVVSRLPVIPNAAESRMRNLLRSAAWKFKKQIPHRTFDSIRNDRITPPDKSPVP